MKQFKEHPLDRLVWQCECFMVGSYWVCHWKKNFWFGGCDGIGGLAYLLFCAAYWSRQPRIFRSLSRSCFIGHNMQVMCMSSYVIQILGSKKADLILVTNGSMQEFARRQRLAIYHTSILRHRYTWHPATWHVTSYYAGTQHCERRVLSTMKHEGHI